MEIKIHTRGTRCSWLSSQIIFALAQWFCLFSGNLWLYPTMIELIIYGTWFDHVNHYINEVLRTCILSLFQIYAFIFVKMFYTIKDIITYINYKILDFGDGSQGSTHRSAEHDSMCQIWVSPPNMFGKCPCSLHVKDLFCSFWKRQIHCRSYKRLNVRSLSNYLYFYSSGQQSVPRGSYPFFISAQLILHIVFVLKYMPLHVKKWSDNL